RRIGGRQVASVTQVGRGHGFDDNGWRIIGDEVPCQLRREVTRGGRVQRQVTQRALALLDTCFGIAAAEQGARARLVERGVEMELARLPATQPALLPAERPAGEDGGELAHILLRVTALHTQRMQLEDLAAEILV